MAGTLPKCRPMGGVCLQEVSVNGSSTVYVEKVWETRQGLKTSSLAYTILLVQG